MLTHLQLPTSDFSRVSYFWLQRLTGCSKDLNILIIVGILTKPIGFVKIRKLLVED